jgi:ubiquinone/menaquinone biosynthesis C-methylase UbiE
MSNLLLLTESRQAENGTNASSAETAQLKASLKRYWAKRILLYRCGDVGAGALIGIAVVLVHHFIAPTSYGLVVEVVLVMLLGMAAQMGLCMLIGGLLGSIEVLIPGSIVGMLGMALPFVNLSNLRIELLVGAVGGSLVFLLFDAWDYTVSGRTQSPSRDGHRSANKCAWTIPMPAWAYDLLEGTGSRRRAKLQQHLYRKMNGNVLFVAAGTGLNFPNLPPLKNIVAIDINADMLARALQRAEHYSGTLKLQVADVQQLPFADESFDTVATASTFCSVPDPVRGLQELHRVLRPGGQLLMFEHVRSHNWFLALELDFLSWMMRHIAPAMNRDTMANVAKAGFVIDRVTCAYVDIFVAIEAHRC